MKKKLQIFLSLTLVFALLLQLSVSVMANVGTLINNTAAQNEAIYEELSKATNGTSDEVYALLDRLGLLDENGNIDLTTNLTLDGVSMTVDEVRALLNDPTNDLNKMVDVDGTPITLQNLKTMLEIETELARIKDTYFSGKTFGTDASNNLNSLMAQIETNGISLTAAATTNNPSWKFSIPNGLTGDPITDTRIPLNFEPVVETKTIAIELVDGTSSMGTNFTVYLYTPNNAFEATYLIPNKNGTVSTDSASPTSIYLKPNEKKFSFKISTKGFSKGDINNPSKSMAYLVIKSDNAPLQLTTNLRSGSVMLPVRQKENPGEFDWNTLVSLVNNPFTYNRTSTDVASNGYACEFKPTHMKIPVIGATRNMTEADAKKATALIGFMNSVDLQQREVTFNGHVSLGFYNYSTKNVTNTSNLRAFATQKGTNTPVLYKHGNTPRFEVRPAGGQYTPKFYNNGLDSAVPGTYTLDKANFNGTTKIETDTPRIDLNSGLDTTITFATTVPTASLTHCEPYISIPISALKYYPSTSGGYEGPFDHSEVQDKKADANEAGIGDYYITNRINAIVNSSSISLDETSTPSIISVTSPPGTYEPNQIIPVMVKFSEPVCCNSQITLNGKKYTCVDRVNASSFSDTHVYRYTVPAIDNTKLYCEAAAGDFKDPFGNFSSVYSSAAVDGVTIESTFMRHAFSSATISVTSSDATKGAKVGFLLNANEAYKQKYTSYDNSGAESRKAPYALRLQGTTTPLIQCTLEEKANGSFYSNAVLPPLYPGTFVYDILSYEMKGGKWETTPTNTGKTYTVTVKPPVYVNGVTIKDADPRRELVLSETYVPVLSLTFTGSPDSQSGKWSSSDPEIATIDETTGVITLVGTKLGDVQFTFTANDGGKKDPNTGNVKVATSEIYKVISGSKTAIVIPEGGNDILAVEKTNARVRWYGNIAQLVKPGDNITYKVELFSGVVDKNTNFDGKAAIYTAANLPLSTNMHDIPGTHLKDISENGIPSYTVRVSAPDPKISSQTLSAFAYITVKPVPVSVRLTKPKSVYLLDNSTKDVPVSWQVTNASPQTTGTLTVERVVDGKAATTVLTKNITSFDTSASFKPVAVAPNLRDLYIVTVKLRNHTSDPWNTDSYQLYVYNHTALDILVGKNGTAQDSLTLSNNNNPLISKGTPTNSEKIISLRDKLALNELVGINYKSYPWSALKDGIKWSSEDDTKVGINYKQGSFYEDIKRFGYSSYLPSSTMAIAGLGETLKTKVTATHANTGMETAIDVKVESLENKLFLFQMSPMIQTTLEYTTSGGGKMIATTNDNGTLALYEKNGIQGVINLRAEDSNKDVYLGTIYDGRLLSGEGNTLVGELYPLNTIRLEKVAKTELYMKLPNGAPAKDQQFNIRGGVYKNDGYCSEAMFGVNGGDLKDGKKPQLVTTDSEGKLTIGMDISQFWSSANGETDTAALKGSDKLQYIFEITDPTNSVQYYPVLCYVDGVSTTELGSRIDERIIPLESATTRKAFISTQQTVDVNGNVTDVRGREAFVGPNEISPSGTVLKTMVLLWGMDSGEVEVVDEFGYRPKYQESKVITYPFSSIPLIENKLTLEKYTMVDSGWIPDVNGHPGKPRTIKLNASKDGVFKNEMTTSLKATDLSRAEKLDGENVQNIVVDVAKGGTMPNIGEMKDDNAVVNGLLELLGKTGGPIDSSKFKLIISPGKDIATFNAFIWAGYNSLGLEKIDYNENIKVEKHILEDDLKLGFNKDAANELATGGKGVAKTGADFARSGKNANSNKDFGGQLEGFYEGLIKYNFDSGKWEMLPLTGGFTVGFGGSFGKSINQMVGPIPITASFELGAAIQLDFKMASRYKVMGTGLEWKDGLNAQYVNDYLTTLRINAYFEAFGGIGFDFSIIALKLGIFGRMSVDNSNSFLSRTYLKNDALRQLNGQAVNLTGEVGIKFVVSVLGASYEAVLASVGASWSKTFRDFDKINNYWKNTGSGLGRSLDAVQRYGAANNLTLVDASTHMGDRDYLDNFTRSWGAPPYSAKTRALVPGVTPLTTQYKNAYPFALPQITDDGTEMLFIDDQKSVDPAKTRVYTAVMAADGTYSAPSEISKPANFDGFGDSGLSVAGDQNMAVAAWIRQNTDPEKKAGEAIDENTQAVLMNATDIVASVKLKNGAWTSTRITENGNPDLAPVVATNGKDAIVAWRSVYTNDTKLSFEVQDNIVYKMYKNGTWGDTKTLYNGTSGAVKGITVSMLQDGTAAVVYTLDRDGKAESYEMACSIVNSQGEPARSLMLSADEFPDENPQIVSVDCGTEMGERFIVGWYSKRNSGGDIRMAMLDKDGLPSASFPESLGEISANIGSNFRFISAKKLDELAIMWTVTSQEQGEHGDTLMAIKLLPKDGKVNLSAPMEVVTAQKNTNIDHFDAYISGTNKLKAVIQGTEYKANDFETIKDDKGNEIKVPKDETYLYLAETNFKNRMTLSSMSADYQNLALNSFIPLQFTVTNNGYSTLNSVAISLDRKSAETFTVDLSPNESTTLTCVHGTGSTITNVNYSIVPTFSSTALPAVTGTLYLDYPDVGISSMEVVGQDKGKRDLRLALYNGGITPLAGSGSTLNVSFYDDSLMETPVEVSYNGAPTKSIQISDLQSLKLCDDGVLSLGATFDFNGYKNNQNGEIPPTGIELFAKVTVTKNGNTLAEYRDSNNTANTHLDSMLTRANEPVTVAVSMDSDKSATVTVRNNALSPLNNGNVTALLMDKDGKVIETKQSVSTLGSPLSLSGEETKPLTFSFIMDGTAVKAVYSEMSNADTNELSVLQASGVPVKLADFTLDNKGNYVASVSTDLLKTQITALPKNPNATVKVKIGDKVLDSKLPLNLKVGANTITIEVQVGEGAVRSYVLTVTRTGETTDAEIIAAALSAVVGGTISVPHGTDKTGKEVAVGNYVKNLLKNVVSDVTVAVSTKVNGDYLVTLSKGTVKDTKTITMVINEEAKPPVPDVTTTTPTTTAPEVSTTTTTTTAPEVSTTTTTTTAPEVSTSTTTTTTVPEVSTTPVTTTAVEVTTKAVTKVPEVTTTAATTTVGAVTTNATTTPKAETTTVVSTTNDVTTDVTAGTAVTTTMPETGVSVALTDPTQGRPGIAWGIVKDEADGSIAFVTKITTIHSVVVVVDGKVVDPKCYTLEGNGTVVKFTAEYSKYLAESKHTVLIKSVAEDGIEEEATGIIENGVEKETIAAPPTNPNTGRRLPIALMAICGASLLLGIYLKRKK